MSLLFCLVNFRQFSSRLYSSLLSLLFMFLLVTFRLFLSYHFFVVSSGFFSCGFVSFHVFLFRLVYFRYFSSLFVSTCLCSSLFVVCLGSRFFTFLYVASIPSYFSFCLVSFSLVSSRFVSSILVSFRICSFLIVFCRLFFSLLFSSRFGLSRLIT